MQRYLLLSIEFTNGVKILAKSHLYFYEFSNLHDIFRRQLSLWTIEISQNVLMNHRSLDLKLANTSSFNFNVQLWRNLEFISLKILDAYNLNKKKGISESSPVQVRFYPKMQDKLAFVGINLSLSIVQSGNIFPQKSDFIHSFHKINSCFSNPNVQSN